MKSMYKIPYTKKSVITAACIAMCAVLPMIFHAIPNAGNIWLPMHIPVLLCGLLCGWKFGLLCGVAGPFISSILTQMPPAAYLPSMILELAAYGGISGALSDIIHTGNNLADLEISLILSMIGGRLIYGVANSLIFHFGNYSLKVWLTSAFLTAIPGIILQLFLIPTVIIALQRADLIPERY